MTDPNVEFIGVLAKVFPRLERNDESRTLRECGKCVGGAVFGQHAVVIPWKAYVNRIVPQFIMRRHSDSSTHSLVVRLRM